MLGVRNLKFLVTIFFRHLPNFPQSIDVIMLFCDYRYKRYKEQLEKNKESNRSEEVTVVAEVSAVYIFTRSSFCNHV